MKKSKLFIVAILMINFQLLMINCSAQYTNLLDFAGTTDGSNPQGSVFYDGTFLYGVTSNGGLNDVNADSGKIFKIKPDGTGYVLLHNFALIADDGRGGSSSTLISDGTFLYGTISGGGVNDQGILFKIKPDGTGYSRVMDFADATTGSSPSGSLIYDGTYLYGTTTYGGPEGDGTVFKIMPDGTGFAIVHAFDAAATFYSYSPEDLYFDGTFLYGTTLGGANANGTIFKVKPDGTSYSKIFDFNGATDGASPNGAFVSDGTYLYGITEQGGTNFTGILYKIMPDGTGFVKLLDFLNATDGGFPYGSLMLDGSFLYGTASTGGANTSGVLFKIGTDGTGYSQLMDFNGPTSGSSPTGSLYSDGSTLYGMTMSGGANVFGTVFKYKYCTLVTANASTTTVCEGTSITLTGGGAATSYSWSGGVTDAVGFAAPSATTTYTVTGTGGNTCTNSATVTITIATPTVVANASATTVCAGTSVTLTGGGAVSYSWSGGVTDGVGFVPTTTATYTVTGTDVNSCTNTVTKTITVNSTPTVIANASATNVCGGTSVTLTGSGTAVSYAWSGGVTDGVGFAAPSATTTYTVTGTDVSSCTNSATVTITIIAPTVMANASATTVCAGASVTLTGSGTAVSYAWSGGVTDGVGFAVPSATTTYTVTGTDANSCTNTATKTITVNTLPSISINGGNTTICNGNSATLTVSGGISYAWSTAATTSAITVSPTVNTSYTVTAADGNGCSNTATSSLAVSSTGTCCIVSIPDANFKAALVNSSFININSDGEIQCSEATAYTGTIDVTSKSISSLTGISSFTNITSLYCSSNQLTSLDVSGCTALTYLYCGYNQLTNLNFSGCTALIALGCQNNQLTSLNISGLTSLANLNCYGNQLTSLNVSGLTGLTSLSCYNNQLTSLNASGCSGLIHLYCYNNKITSLDVSSCTSLKYLGCRNNLLTSLDVSSCTALTTLYCEENQLTSLNATTNTQLTRINFGNNKVTTVSLISGGGWSVLTSPNLTFFDCSNNLMTSLDLSAYASLDTLICSGNQLTSLDVSANTALTYFKCDSNQIASLSVSSNTACNFLNCSYNQLTSLNVAANTALDSLDCSNNQLTTLDVAVNTNLLYLNCDANLLTGLAVAANTALKDLRCSHNQITGLNVAANTALQDLRCSDNQLTGLAVATNTVLISLSCDSNQIANLDLSANTGLVSLDCRKNQLIDLNIKNGNNTNLTAFNTTANGLLFCIQVDDTVFMKTNWANAKDASAQYNNDCSTVTEVAGHDLQNGISIYPNPSSGMFTIESTGEGIYSIINELGQTVQLIKLNTENNYKMNVENLNQGIYFIRGYNNGRMTRQKIVIAK